MLFLFIITVLHNQSHANQHFCRNALFIEYPHLTQLPLADAMPRCIPTIACTQVPQLSMESLIQLPVSETSNSQPQLHSQVISQDIKKITTSVSTLRLPNVKASQDKVSSLFYYLFLVMMMACVVTLAM